MGRDGVIPRAGVHARTAVRIRDLAPKLHGRAMVKEYQSVGAHACERRAIRAVPQAVHCPPRVALLGGGGDAVLPPPPF